MGSIQKEGIHNRWQGTVNGRISNAEKGAVDAARGKLFTKLVKEITNAAA